MLYVLIAILTFGILIALHELGHFIVAKLCGVKVNEFSIGMGPQLLHTQKGETVYSIRALPVGGFCAMEGEGETSGDPRAFPNRPWWQRLLVLLAGVTVNFLTGLVILVFLFSGQESLRTTEITTVLPESRAYTQGLQPGDRLVKMDGHTIYQVNDVYLFLDRLTQPRVELTVERNGERHDLTVDLTPVQDEETGERQWMLGITLGSFEEATFGNCLRQGWNQAVCYVRLVWVSLGDLVRGKVGLKDMSGVIEITHMMAQVGEEGAAAAEAAGTSAIVGAMNGILDLAAFLAINLAVMNLLPIPALDGGQIFLMALNGLLQKVRGRSLDPKYQNMASGICFIALMALMVLVMVNDIFKLLHL